jgi:hypothetical protein
MKYIFGVGLTSILAAIPVVFAGDDDWESPVVRLFSTYSTNFELTKTNSTDISLGSLSPSLRMRTPSREYNPSNSTTVHSSSSIQNHPCLMSLHVRYKELALTHPRVEPTPTPPPVSQLTFTRFTSSLSSTKPTLVSDWPTLLDTMELPQVLLSV